jgi:prophage regulatory protein
MTTDLVPPLVGAHEIRALLGNVTRQRIYQLTTRRDFPDPVANLSQGKVWRESDVKAWNDRRRSNTRSQK